MYATCASETSSCRLLLLRGGAAEPVIDGDAEGEGEGERENRDRRRKMRVTELNIVRIDLIGFFRNRLNLGQGTKRVGLGFGFGFLVAIGCRGYFVEGRRLNEVEVFM